MLPQLKNTLRMISGKICSKIVQSGYSDTLAVYIYNDVTIDEKSFPEGYRRLRTVNRFLARILK